MHSQAPVSNLPCLPGFRRDSFGAGKKSFARNTTLGDDTRRAARPLSAHRAPPLSSRAAPAKPLRPLTASAAREAREQPAPAARAARPASAPRRVSFEKQLAPPVSTKTTAIMSELKRSGAAPAPGPALALAPVGDAMGVLSGLVQRFPACVRQLRECMRELDLSRSGAIGEDEFMDAIDMACPGVDDDMRFVLAEAFFPEPDSQVEYRPLLDRLEQGGGRRAPVPAATGLQPMGVSGTKLALKPKLAPLGRPPLASAVQTPSSSRKASKLRGAVLSARSDVSEEEEEEPLAAYDYEHDEDDQYDSEDEPQWVAAPSTPSARQPGPVPAAWGGGWTPRSVESGSEYSDLSARSDLSWGSSGSSPKAALSPVPSPTVAGMRTRHTPFSFESIPEQQPRRARPVSASRTSASMMASTGHLLRR